ncbi:hypothetical protein BDV32DRAFT_121209 [Aspergillus pseudonomiae]|nr:hypothetical protein BDV32DRAFT_121209 [Aspergillus pseudonomiae]
MLHQLTGILNHVIPSRHKKVACLSPSLSFLYLHQIFYIISTPKTQSIPYTLSKAMSSNCDDCTFNQYVLYWLVYYSWHWILFWIYVCWWEDSRIIHRSRLEPPPSPISWLERKGYLHTRKDARRLFIIHLILLALEPVEGYWILTGWYRAWLPAWTMVPDPYDIGGNFGRYIGLIALPVGLVMFSLVGVILMISTVTHLRELWSWEPADVQATENGGGKMH